MGPQLGYVVSAQGVTSAICKQIHPILRGQQRSPWLLKTTYVRPGMILQGIVGCTPTYVPQWGNPSISSILWVFMGYNYPQESLEITS